MKTSKSEFYMSDQIGEARGWGDVPRGGILGVERRPGSGESSRSLCGGPQFRLLAIVDK